MTTVFRCVCIENRNCVLHQINYGSRQLARIWIRNDYNKGKQGVFGQGRDDSDGRGHMVVRVKLPIPDCWFSVLKNSGFITQ